MNTFCGNLGSTLAFCPLANIWFFDDPKHTSKLCKRYLEINVVVLFILEWPAHSPDLNPNWAALVRVEAKTLREVSKMIKICEIQKGHLWCNYVHNDIMKNIFILHISLSYSTLLSKVKSGWNILWTNVPQLQLLYKFFGCWMQILIVLELLSQIFAWYRLP